MTQQVKEITVQQLKEMYDTVEDFQLIDVREPHEFKEANLKGELIPLATVLNNVDKINRSKKVVIHCRSGMRSANAIQALQQQFGFDNLYNLKGGILAWINQINANLNQIP